MKSTAILTITLACLAATASATLRGVASADATSLLMSTMDDASDLQALTAYLDEEEAEESNGIARRLKKKFDTYCKGNALCNKLYSKGKGHKYEALLRAKKKQQQQQQQRQQQQSQQKKQTTDAPQPFNKGWGKKNTFAKRLAESCCALAGDDVTTYSWSEFAALPRTAAAIAAGEPVTVECGQKVLVDEPTIALAGLFVEGHLEFVDGVDVRLETDYVLNCGVFAIGSEERAHQSKATIVLTGDWAEGDGASELVWRNKMFGKAGFVTYGGLTYLRGASAETTTWTKLAATGKAGDTTLEVRTAGEAWKPGDKLLVVGTGREYDHSEVETRVIASVEGRTVHLKSPLKFDHLGCEDGPAMAAQNAQGLAAGKIMQGIGDKCIMAGEVASLTRNIVITSPKACARGNFIDTWGHKNHAMAKKSKQPQCGHFIISHTNKGRVSGVEFRNLGQKITKGKYPLHVHMSGKAPLLRIEDNVVHHSHNRGIVLHAVKNANVRRNTVYYTQGHSFLLEDGVETGNLIEQNLAVKPHSVSWGCKSSHDQTFRCGDRTDNTVAGFWIPNVNNKFIGNVAVTHGRGFAIEARHVMGDTRLNFEPEAGRVTSKLKHGQRMDNFRGNEVHGCLWGFFNYPQLNVLDGSRGYEGLVGWKNHIAIHIKNMRVFPVRGALLLENARAITAHTTFTRIAVYNSKIVAVRKGALAFGVGRWGGAGNPTALDKQYVEIDEFTRDYAYCFGGFGENSQQMGYYLMGGRPGLNVRTKERCIAFAAKAGIELDGEGDEDEVAPEDDEEDVEQPEDNEEEAEEDDVDEEEEGEDDDDADTPKLINVVHKFSKTVLQALCQRWKQHPKGSKNVILKRVYNVLDKRATRNLPDPVVPCDLVFKVKKDKVKNVVVPWAGCVATSE